PAQNLNWAMNQRLVELSKTMKISGFRAGKVPINLVRQRYGQAVFNEVVEAVVQNTSAQALNSKSLRAATRPKFDKIELKPSGELEYSMSIEVLPEISLTDFGAIKLTKEIAEVSDSEISNSLERLAAETRSFTPAEPSHVAAIGDQVVIDFVGTKGNEEFTGGSAENFKLELGSNRFVPGFEDQLVGVKAGDKRTVKLTFPTEYPAKNLAGEAVVFAVTVHGVEIRKAMTVDDDFAKYIGFPNLVELKDAMKQRLAAEYLQQSRLKIKRSLLDELNKTHSFELPKTMVEDEFTTIWQQLLAAEAEGEFDQSMVGKDEEYKKKEYRQIAERRVRLGLVLAEVGRINNLTISEEELRRAMRMEAMNYPGQEKMVMDFYRKNVNAQERLRAPLLEDKVVDFILELSKVETKTVSSEQLLAEEEAEVGKVSSAKTAKKTKKSAAKGEGE
ncbi:MAG: trigger factor, partial [Candidatus Pacebacteria bacterium]|nr:trigger factor [Candidatus Paceibacterota bacterium]